MTADVSVPGNARNTLLPQPTISSDARLLRTVVVAAGIFWSILFVVVGLDYELQLFGDGSIFSYSIAVHDAWAFHWHNISGRLFVYLFSYVPAEAYVNATGDAHGGIVVYGFLFFVAQALGLIATLAFDRSQGHLIFGYACCSTACLCPLIFGFPTEMWMAHALFWPVLAVCHYAPRGISGMTAVFAALLALVFTHEGALLLVIVILATLLLRGIRDSAFMRGVKTLLPVMSIWAFVKLTIRPDDYFAVVFARAALHVFDVTIFTSHLLLLLLTALAMYVIAFSVLRRWGTTNAVVCAGSIVAVSLVVYWLWFDHALHADNRYYMRTALLIATPMLGVFAAIDALRGDGQRTLVVPLLPPLFSPLASGVSAQAALGALLLVMLVHSVETAKFVSAWSYYKDAVRGLAMGTASDPAFGDAQFVSSAAIGADLNRLSWSSTTQFLSVLVAPKFAPKRLVLDAAANYFWLPCETAAANEADDRAVPVESRRLVRVHACLHRPNTSSNQTHPSAR